MGYIQKMWTFDTTSEGLADVGNSAVITGVWDATGNGGGAFDISATSNGSESFRRAATGETWETWGVPPGLTVTSVEILSADSHRWTAGSGTQRFRMRLVDSAATSLVAADLFDNSPATGATDSAGVWVPYYGAGAKAVNAGKQASTTDVRLEIQFDPSVAVSYDVSWDNIQLQINFSDPVAVPTKYVPSERLLSGRRI